MKHTRDSIHILKRIGYPTKLSPEPYSTQWHVLQESGNPIVYIQVSHDDVNPEWIRLSEMLEKVFFDQIENASFMEQCIRKYKSL